MKKQENPRYVAAAALLRMRRGGRANAIWNEALAAASLTERDRAFAGALFFGAAERLVTLEWLVEPCLSRPLHKLDEEVCVILLTGAYQLHYMRVPPRAAVDESVKLARAFGKSSAAGLVNAVLRALARDCDGKGVGPDFEKSVFANELQRVCVTYSVSEAVASAVMRALPEAYHDFFAASFAGRETCLRVNSLKTTALRLADTLAQWQVPVRAGQVENCLYAQLPGGVAHDTLFEQGWYHVQGEASQIACACLAVRPGMRVLDLCAAPGGKSATLAQYLGGGAGLTASDISGPRLELMRGTLRRLGIADVVMMQNDAAVYDPTLVGQDRVLCDVPCSGLGVLAQKPDLRYVTRDFEQLPALQLKILRTAARYVKQGGRLVYSTCTIRPEENREVVCAFLAEQPDFTLTEPQIEPNGAVMNDKMMTILPQSSNMDGFFVASMVRV